MPVATKTKKSAPPPVPVVRKPKGRSAGPKVIEVPALRKTTMLLRLRGTGSLVCNNFDKKARQQMLAKQMKEGQVAREAKNPDECFRRSLYTIKGKPGYWFPVIAFKAAAVGACRFVSGMKMTEARGAFHIRGVRGDDGREYVQIMTMKGKKAVPAEPTMREDVVRLPTGVADLRHRGEFVDWIVDLKIEFNEAFISPQQIVNLFNHAGFGQGVGEYRAEKGGSWGTFEVEGAVK